MIQVYDYNRRIKICDELITDGSIYLKGFRHLLLKRLLKLQISEFLKMNYAPNQIPFCNTKEGMHEKSKETGIAAWALGCSCYDCNKEFSKLLSDAPSVGIKENEG